jgi:hypothetical protein
MYASLSFFSQTVSCRFKVEEGLGAAVKCHSSGCRIRIISRNPGYFVHPEEGCDPPYGGKGMGGGTVHPSLQTKPGL